MMIIAQEEFEYQQKIEEGKEPVRTGHGYLGIREDEETAMRTTLFDAFNQKRELERQFFAAYGKIPTARTAEEWTARADARAVLNRQRREASLGAIAKLKQELGEEAFKKLDAYLYGFKLIELKGLKTPANGGPAPAVAPSPSQPGGNPAPAQAPGAQP
jgi:hypothetical protein